MVEQFANDPGTELDGSVSDSQDTLTVVDATGYPDPPFRIRVSDELMMVTGKFGSGDVDWAVDRGIEGTAAVAHANGQDVTHVLTAGAVDLIRADTGVRWTLIETFEDSDDETPFDWDSGTIDPLYDEFLVVGVVETHLDGQRPNIFLRLNNLDSGYLTRRVTNNSVTTDTNFSEIRVVHHTSDTGVFAGVHRFELTIPQARGGRPVVQSVAASSLVVGVSLLVMGYNNAATADVHRIRIWDDYSTSVTTARIQLFGRNY